MAAYLNQQGFSLVEAVVAGVIFSIAVVGVFASLAAINPDRTVGAAQCGQQLLEDLRADVDGRTWDDGNANRLTVTPVGQDRVAPPCTQNGLQYNISYNVVNVGSARQVTVNVTW